MKYIFEKKFNQILDQLILHRMVKSVFKNIFQKSLILDL